MHILKYFLVVKNLVLSQYLFLETEHECLSALSFLIFLLFHYYYCYYWASQVVLVEKNLSASPGDSRDVGSILRLEYPLEEDMATHSSIPAWRIPWTEEPGGLQYIGLQRVRHDWSNLACMHCYYYYYYNYLFWKERNYISLKTVIIKTTFESFVFFLLELYFYILR